MGARLRFFSAVLVFLSCSSVLLAKSSTQNTCKKSKIEINLSDGFAIPSNFLTIPCISQNGDQVFLSFWNNGQGTAQPVAQLYNNVNGTLVLAQTYPYDPVNFPMAAYGAASPDFTKFSVIENNTFSKIRVRVLDQGFNVIAERIFTNDFHYGPDGGRFSEDSHYLIFTYSLPNAAGNLLDTLVYILDATKSNLPTVASTTIFGGVDNSVRGPTLFTLKDAKGNKNLYFSFVSITSDLNENFYPPYFSQIYGVNLKTGTISCVASEPLPIYSENTVQVRKSGKEAIISHGGFCIDNPALPTIYTSILPSQISAIPGDYDAARAYRFDGSTLNLIFKQAVNCCNFLLPYPPSDGCTYFLGTAVDTFTTPGVPTARSSNPMEFWSIYELSEGPSGLVLLPQVGPFQDMVGAYDAFSQDGNWMIRSGLYGYFNGNPNDDAYGIKNVLLFKISSAPYSPVCSK